MNKPSQGLAVANYFMLAAFLFSAIVQYNDPDPWRWIGVYGLAAILSILFARGKFPWIGAAALGLLALIWAGFIAPSVIGKTSLVDIFRSYEMKSPEVELAREMGGLLIVAVWMAVLIFFSARHRADKS